MDIRDVIMLVRTLFAQPEKGWVLIRGAHYPWQQIFGRFMLPLVFLSTLAVVYILQPQVEGAPDLSPNQLFLITLTGSAGSILLGGYLIAALTPRFKGISSMDMAVALVSFAYAPVFLASVIASLHPSLQLLNLVAMVYMLYLYFKGTGILMEVPRDRQMGFTVVSIIILFVVRLFTAFILAAFL